MDWNELMWLAKNIDDEYGKLFNRRIGDDVGELMCDGIADYDLEMALDGYYKCVEFMKNISKNG